MVFSSLEFIFVFLASVLAVYYLVPPKARNIVLLLFSLVFYGWGEPVYVFLMIATITVDYICGYIIGRDLDSKPKRAKVTLIVSIVINLALLGVFKYYDFFAGTLNSLLGRGVFPTLGLTLPIGISFYTFQALSYVIDVYRRDARVQKNIAAFGTYVTLFPQLIAGPIVRYADVDDQLRERTHSLTLFASGCRTFICGLAKKILLANAAGAMWNSLSAAAEPDALGAWLAIVFYTFQIYFDFSGYSDMAIGMGRMMGFNYPENFNYPYISRSVTEFWRRWHITMSTFFRDYVYIPLGGSRCSVIKWLRNVFIVWFLTGLWHGAAWHYVAWGLYFGVLLVVEKFLLRKLLEKSHVISHIYAMLMIICGWVIFRCDSVSDALSFIGSMFGASGLYGSDTVPSPVLLQQSGVSTVFFVTLIFAVLFSTPTIPWLKNKLESSCTKLALRGAVYCTADFVLIVLLVLSSVQLALGSYNPFIYFDF